MKGPVLYLHPHPLPYSNLHLPTSPTLPTTPQSHANFKSEAMLLIHVRLPQASTVHLYVLPGTTSFPFLHEWRVCV